MTLRVRLFWALLLSAAVGLGSYFYLSALQQEVPVVVAARDIPERTVITQEMLRVVRVRAKERDTVFSRAVSEPDMVVGALTLQDVSKGEALRSDPHWITRDEGAVQAVSQRQLSYFLPRETRAVTVGVDSQGIVAGRVREGDLVDVLFTSRDNSTGGVYAAMILQHVRVLGVDGGGGQYQVTLLVTPEQALDLTLAKRRGIIDLALSPPAPDTVNLPPASPLKFLSVGLTP